jgi:3-hydroxybutyryl-CoA dehydrogenase
MMHSVLDRTSTIGVIGAGTMGTGIAQLAAQHGHKVVLYDSTNEALVNARSNLAKVFARLVEKGTLTSQEAEEVKRRITFADGLRGLSHCKLVVEAILEDMSVKQDLFQQLDHIVSESCIIATNTSSLSVTALATATQHPKRVLGVHFFNPAPLMALVEVVPWVGTPEETLISVTHLIRGWGKKTVRTKDTPGFIVNRVARPFYTEALRIYDQGIADHATIDWAMKELGSFRMGPFELMDMIGNDINFKVTETVFQSFFYEPRFRPSLSQKKLVEAGMLGKKRNQGWYDYALHAENAQPVKDPALGKEILNRVLAMLINEAAETVLQKVASVEDVDLAMTSGVNYPKGLLRWCDELGVQTIVDELSRLQAEYQDERYRPSPLLKRMAREGKRFYV